MKDLIYFLNEGNNETIDFVNCLNKYIDDNFSKDCVNTLTKYKDLNNEFTKPKYNRFAYRGLFFNNMTPEKVEKLKETLPKTYKMDKIESWTSNWDEATIFAGGKSIYDVDLNDVDEWSLVNDMDKTQCGIVLKMENLETKDVIFDADYYLQNDNANHDIRVIEPHELILKKKSKVKIYIFMLLYNNDIEYEVGQ